MSKHFAAVNYSSLPHLGAIYCKLIHAPSSRREKFNLCIEWNSLACDIVPLLIRIIDGHMVR